MAEFLKQWLEWVYEANIQNHQRASETLAEQPDLLRGNAWLACAVGDESTIRHALSGDPGWVNRSGGPLGMPPLVAVTHSSLILEPAFETQLVNSARLLIQNDANVNGTWTNPKWPDFKLSALYGAAGRTHHAAMTKLLLDAGANPDDNESLYHSVEARDPTCTRLLLDAGVRVSGTNAIARALDYGGLENLKLILQRGGDAKERPWIHHAILRGRSLTHIQMLVDAGADLRAVNREGISLYRWAQMRGSLDVVEMLHRAGIEEQLTDEEQFVAACARGDEAAARAIQQKLPDIFSRLTSRQLQVLPELADVGDLRAVRTMLNVGWPREVKAAWGATALNLAVYRGDAQMAELLLQKGADWRTEHGFGDNVLGTLSHSSQNDPEDPSAPRDYVGCARVLMRNGVPQPAERYSFSAAVQEFFDTHRDSQQPLLSSP